MNLTDFGEQNGAKQVLFLLDRNHSQEKEYKRMFRVIDAVRLHKDEASDLIRKDVSSSDDEDEETDPAERVKRVISNVAFYKLEL